MKQLRRNAITTRAIFVYTGAVTIYFLQFADLHLADAKPKPKCIIRLVTVVRRALPIEEKKKHNAHFILSVPLQKKHFYAA